MIQDPAQITRQHLAIVREPTFSLIRKRCPAIGCGKQVTARQLAQYGCCSACTRAVP